ncbi:MAG: hypothetical protein KJ734_08790, partial [Chloroflexi bacterium]|nr:hypothetical protein [Chloroflexota bacterium]
TITAPPRRLQPIERPDPLGGEPAMTVLRPNAGEFVYTLNDVWLAIVCDHEFKRNWARMQKAASKTPGATLKQRLIDRLQQAQQDGLDPFVLLDSYPPVQPALETALYMFHEQEMTEDMAW